MGPQSSPVVSSHHQHQHQHHPQHQSIAFHADTPSASAHTTVTLPSVAPPPVQPYATAGPEPRPAGRMRSSIACIRCRRSKVKCVNNGVGTTCRSCENSGRDCAYPPPVATAGTTRRRDSISYDTAPHERRQRPRKTTHTHTNTFTPHAASAPRDSPRPLLDALDPRLLTPQVWQELFDIFQIHYSADLPFLHPPSFLKPLRLVAQQLPPNAVPTSEEHVPAARPPASTEFLLAFLALTARFHSTLVAHHSPSTSSRASNPLIASEYYAAAANERMASIWTDNHAHDIERTQAMLMLGLHEWGMCRGGKAWLAVGMAIRSAQAMGLQYELDLDDEPMSRSLALSSDTQRMGVDSHRKSSMNGKSPEDVFIQQEIRRRTFWSCYIMDRYLSSGKYRPQMLHANELRIQLPASERSFLFAEKVRTLMLGEEDKTNNGTGRAEVRNSRQQSVLLGTGTPEPSSAASPRGVPLRDEEDEKGKLEVGSDEGLVSRYVKILEIYGKVIKWSCSGGRRVEEHPPWDSRCEFNRLYRQCQDFKSSLPRQHTLTPQNTQAHISLKASTPYTLVHTVYLLCQIMLHREYVPFVPIRCSKPEGPMDPPTFPPDRYNVPHGFWEESARECFRSAREIMDLVRTCQEWSALVETPIVGFAIYTVAFVGVYCINFPWMDPEGYMCTRPEPTGKAVNGEQFGGSKGFEAARKALEMIGLMRTKLHMADGWFKTINRMHKYFRRMKLDYQKNSHAVESSSEGESPLSTRHLSLRDGGLGGGLDEFKLLERTLQDFGNLEDHDVEMTDPTRPDSKPLDGVYDDSHSGTTVKSEEAGERADRVTSAPDPQKSESGAWSAINAVPGAHASRNTSISTPSSAQFRSYESYPSQTPQPTAAAHQLQHPQHQPSGQQPPASTYNHQMSSFRPTYSETSGSAGAPPSLTSPAAHSATGSTASQSDPSPPYERGGHPTYASWTPHNNTYPMSAPPPPPPNPYTAPNGVVSQYHHHHHPPPSTMHHPPPSIMHHHPSNSSYPPPGQPGHAAQQLQHPQDVQPPTWDPTTKEAWLNSIDTRLGGDDVAAFVDGGEMGEWATTMAAHQGFGGGWLSTVWGGGGAT